MLRIPERQGNATGRCKCNRWTRVRGMGPKGSGHKTTGVTGRKLVYFLHANTHRTTMTILTNDNEEGGKGWGPKPRNETYNVPSPNSLPQHSYTSLACKRGDLNETIQGVVRPVPYLGCIYTVFLRVECIPMGVLPISLPPQGLNKNRPYTMT